MRKHFELIIASILAVICAAGAVICGIAEKRGFNVISSKYHLSTGGYDQSFINLVNSLENELEIRARFGYTGGKDPMSGRVREVVVARPPAVRRPAQTQEQATKPAAQDQDPVRLTAIIYDDKSQRYTAIVMVGERSLSVDIGEQVLDRKVTGITGREIVMETPIMLYRYDVLGGSVVRPK
jgi:hypothetical protein